MVNPTPKKGDMPRRKPLHEPQAPPLDVHRVATRWLLQIIALVMVIGLLLGGLIWLAKYAREQMREDERFQAAFADIECNPPAPLDRARFLLDVQFYSELPERMSILDVGLADKLKERFAMHPSVARVEAVALERPNIIRVKLIYRQPVLAVEAPPGLAGEDYEPATNEKLKLLVRAVDEQGVLLVKSTPLPPGLPVLFKAPLPASGEGKPWSDEGVLTAARTAARFQSTFSRLGLSAMTCSNQGLILWAGRVKVLWGRLPKDDGSLTLKEKRLLASICPGAVTGHECGPATMVSSGTLGV